MTQNMPPELRLALRKAAAALDPVRPAWLLGGSCGLLLQGVELGRTPRDIDIYSDSVHVPLLHGRLQSWAAGEPVLDREGIYESMLSRYELNGYSLELVGGFKVSAGQSRYNVEVDRLLALHAPACVLENRTLRLMPLAHELVFNVLRDRPDRYVPVAEVIRRDEAHHIGLLERILERNEWDYNHRTLISSLAGI